MKPSLPSALALAFALAAGAPAAAATTAFTGATVHPVSGPPVAAAVLVVEDGTITALGAGIPVPAGATVVDLSGKHVYPGFIHAYSALGLVEITSVRGTVDTTETGDVNANLRAEVAFHADSELLPVAMSGGVLTANVAPRGGVFHGTSALLRLEGWNWEDMTVAAPTGMHVDFPAMRPPSRGFRQPTQEEVDKEKERALKLLNDVLDDARAYDTARRAAEAGEAPAVALDPRFEALRPVLQGETPVWLHASEKTQIEAALDWAEEQGLDRLVLVGGPDLQYVTERLVEEQVPVLLNGVLLRPARSWEPYDAAYAAAARLQEAGVSFAIGDGGSAFGAANARNLPFEAAMAAAFGLPRDAALRSITLSVAELLGVADRLGSIEPGKEATFFVADGDPLEILTRIERAWIAGTEVDLDDRQKRLYRKYNSRPRPEPEG